MARKKTIAEIAKYIAQTGFLLLSTEYKNSGSKLKIQCSKGHEYRTSWNKFRDGCRCPYCAGKVVTYKDVKEFIEDEGYQLLSTEYKNNATKLLVECTNGHQYRTTYNNFKQGHRCPLCVREVPSKKAHTYTCVKKFIESEGYVLVSTEYKNCKTKLTVQCSMGHEYQTTFNNFKTGSRCPFCSKRIITYVDIHREIEEQGYTLLAEGYKNSTTKLEIRCPKGHTYQVTWTNFQQGHRCPKCSNQQSKGELEIVEYLRFKGVYVIERDRSVLDGKELDIFCPDRKWMKERHKK